MEVSGWLLLAGAGLLALLVVYLGGGGLRTGWGRLGFGPRVLVVSHFEPYRDLLVDTLRRAGCRPHPCHPREALSAVGSRAFPVVVSGLALPFLPAATLLAAVKAAAPGTRVILLTGDPESPQAADALRAGAFAVVDKGALADLARRVAEAARGRPAGVSAARGAASARVA